MSHKHKNNKIRRIMLETISSLSVFESFNKRLTTEEINKQKEIIQKINADQWDKNPEHFFNSFSQQKKHTKMLTHYTVEEFSKMDLYKVPGYNIGFAIKPTEEGNELVAVHNAESNVSGIGKPLVQAAIKHGADRLDHFDVKILSGLYQDLGFQEYKRDPYDPYYDMDGSFRSTYGPLDVVYRKLQK